MSSAPQRPSSRASAPKWRSSLSSPKRQKPAAAVSLVFAQPEQGSKLASAIDQLPAVGIDDAASFMSEVSRKRERLNSNASSFMSQLEPRREAPVTSPETGDVSRKRSKLSVDDHDTTGVDAGAPGNVSGAPDAPSLANHPIDDNDTTTVGTGSHGNGPGVLNGGLGVPGSASNPVDLTESPKPMDVDLPPSIVVDKVATDIAPSETQTQQSGLVPFPTSEPPKSVRTSKSTPSRSSWFGFSRAKLGEDDSPTTPESNAKPGSVTPTQSSANPKSTQSEQGQGSGVPTNTVETVDLSNTSPQPAVATSPPRSIPPTSKQPEPLAFSSVQYSPPTQVLKSNATSISSVDEEVPGPRFMSMDGSTHIANSPVVLEPQDTKIANRKPSISSLNPSTSRFTLRLPLLGRPKIPLEQAVATAQAEDVREPPAESDDVKTPTTPVALEESQAEQTINIVPPTPDERPANPGDQSAQSGGESQAESDSRPASWWGYIGWAGQPAAEHATDAVRKDDSEYESSKDTSQATPTPVPESQPSQSSEQPANATDQSAASASENAVSDGSDAKPDRKPASILSADTTKSQVSAWYSPWAWYYSSSANASTADAPQTSEASGASDTTKTESEMVKEEALAREEERASQAEAVSTPEPAAASDPEPEPSNPIQSTIADNRSGWMSFFVSRAATMKAVTNDAGEKQESGMEVMEIDEEAEASTAAVEVAIPARKGDSKRTSVPSPLSLLSTSPKPSSSPTPSSTPVPKSPKSPGLPPQEREPKKSDPPAPPLTDSESIKRDTARGARSPSPTPSKASTPPGSAKPTPPNLVLPTWADTFHSPPRSYTPPRTPNPKSKLTGALSYVAGALFANVSSEGGGKAKGKGKGKNKGKEREQFGTWSATPGAGSSAGTGQQSAEFLTFGQDLPKALDVLGEQLNPYILNGGCRIAVIGVAGWSPGAVTRTLAGGLPSSSNKFVSMTVTALEQFAEENGFKFKKITPMPLEGDGTIRKKVSRVYNHLLGNEEWMEDLHAADVIFVASHSQGAVVSTHLVDRLIEDGHILTARSVDTLAKTAAAIGGSGTASVPTAQAQKVCLLALCGVHLGPLRYLKTSSLLQPYFQYVENASARELFEFQDTESKVSKNYVGALRNILDHGSKVVYIASLNDQVVPIYSGLFTAASHPRILRALYIDNDAYHSSDFLSNLLILLIRILNAGLSDRGLLAHLSEATAGTLSGVGHSTAYEEPATYSLAVKYFFMTNDGSNSDAELVINPFNAVEEQNDYEIPWLLRDMIADGKISHFFAREFAQLRDAFDEWQPKTTILRDMKKKLQPITRLSSTSSLASGSISKL